MRHILKLHRDLDTNSLPQADHDYTIETFDPAIHKQQWLDLNNLIFAHHPDQGNWAMQDLDNRMAEPWFDEKGFFAEAFFPMDRTLFGINYGVGAIDSQVQLAVHIYASK